MGPIIRWSGAAFGVALAAACRDPSAPTNVSTPDAEALSQAVGAAASAYRVEVLPLPTPLATASSGVAINSAGDVVGSVIFPNGFAGAGIWVGSTHVDLGRPTFAAGNPSPTDINDSRTVVGFIRNTDRTQAFIWQDSVYTEIVPPFYTSVAAYGLNNDGVVVGSYRAIGREHAFAYTSAGFIDIHPGVGYIGSRANDVNDAGEAVGVVTLANGESHVAKWGPTDWSFTDLGTLGGRVDEAFGINSSGAVVGTSLQQTLTNRAFYWSASLGLIAGPEPFAATAISDRNRYALTRSGTRREPQLAATARGRLPIEFLPLAPGTSASLANGVNTCGAITGNVYPSPTTPRGVRWTPAACD